MINADKTLRKFGSTLRLEILGDSVRYELKVGRQVIFTGDQFRPSPLISWDSLDACASLMSFLTVQPGDTDDEYFNSYTPAQFAFADSDCAEQWRLWLYDRECY